jgi:hypothetical protein
MQGYVETASIDLPLPLPTLTAPTASFTPLDVSIISRRSVERPGLRFQRRGVDSKGAVANFNETEFITRCFRDDVLHVQSFVQTRGSSESLVFIRILCNPRVCCTIIRS